MQHPLRIKDIDILIDDYDDFGPAGIGGYRLARLNALSYHGFVDGNDRCAVRSRRYVVTGQMWDGLFKLEKSSCYKRCLRHVIRNAGE